MRARSLIVTTLLAFGLSMSAQAQLSIRGGLSLNEFFGIDSVTGETRGLNVGASMGLFGVGPIRVNAEVHYAQKGGYQSSQSIVESALEGGSVEFGIDYLEIPVLARMKLAGVGPVVGFVEGGPSFGWQLDCGVKADASVIAGGSASSALACDQLKSDNIQATIRDFDLGVLLGAGLVMELPGGVGGLSLDARISGSLDSIHGGTSVTDIRNRTMSVMLGYHFGLPDSWFN